jgi:predicted DNA-binding transcriptional regulator AlpA
MSDAVVAKLDELLAAMRAASIPDDKRWLDVDAVAARLSYKPRYVRETLMLRPDFPKPMRADSSGHPRWLASDIHEWALKRRESAMSKQQRESQQEAAAGGR